MKREGKKLQLIKKEKEFMHVARIANNKKKIIINKYNLKPTY